MYCFITKELPDTLRISNRTTPWVFSTPKQSVECGSEKVGKELKISSIWQGRLKMQGLGSEKKKTISKISCIENVCSKIKNISSLLQI